MFPKVRLLIDAAAIQNEGSIPKLAHLNNQAVFHPCARAFPRLNGWLQLEAAETLHTIQSTQRYL